MPLAGHPDTTPLALRSVPQAKPVVAEFSLRASWSRCMQAGRALRHPPDVHHVSRTPGWNSTRRFDRNVFLPSVVSWVSIHAGDFNAVQIGAHVCVGDKAVVNTVNRVETGFAASVEIGSWVIIEPGASLTSCIVGDR